MPYLLSTVFVTKSYGKGKKRAPTKYYNDAEWKALSSEAQVTIINERKKATGDEGNDNKSVASTKSQKEYKFHHQDNEVVGEG